MRYFIRLSFDGRPFHGWQIQQNANTVQAELNRALETLLRTKNIESIGCGRTDTGVHSKKFFAHFDHDNLHDTDEIVHRLNSILPEEIAVHSLFPVGENDHARFSAVSRTYIYRSYNKKDPFLKNSSYFFPFNPDIQKMNSFAQLLMKHTNFSCFAKSNTQNLTNICVISLAEWEKEGEEIVFKITADRFLRNMVRAIVGTLLSAGLDRINIEDFEKILASKSRSEAGVSVPAHGLYLSDVVYPFLVY